MFLKIVKKIFWDVSMCKIKSDVKCTDSVGYTLV